MRAAAARQPALLAALLVALTAWTPRFVTPTLGLDPSWQSGLYMAAEDGLRFGSEIVFTYGPLGYLGLADAPLWFGDLAIVAYLFASVLFVVACLLIVGSLRLAIGTVAAALVTFAALVVADGPELAIVIAVAGSLLALRPAPPRHARVVLIGGGAVLAAVECLVKLSVGPVVFAVCLLGLIGARARPRDLALYAGGFIVATLALWLIAGQSIGDLGGYIGNGREIVSGYSSALALMFGRGWWTAVAALSVIALIAAAAALSSNGDRRARICATALVAIAAFAVFKEGVVRLDQGHITIFFSTALLLWLVLPWHGRGRVVLALGAVGLAAMTLHVRPPGSGPSVNPVSNLRAAAGDARTILSTDRRTGLIQGAKQALTYSYDLRGAARAAVGDRPVTIEPWETAIAWAYDLNWSPLPVFHSYAAYTPKLDELNADRLASPDGPEVVLRHDLGDANTYPTLAIDGRYPGWEAPAQTLATICNFAPELTTRRWQVLSRVPDRCGEPRRIGSVEAGEGESVEVPEAGPGEVVFARVGGLEVSGAEVLQNLLLRADLRYASVGTETYRVVPATAGDGLLLAGPRRVVGAGAFALAPQASSISMAGGGRDLRYDFYSMPVGRSPKPGPGR